MLVKPLNMDMLITFTPSILKSNGYNYICISAIGSNIKYIKDNEYKRNSRVYYYTYNYSMPNILPNECVININ